MKRLRKVFTSFIVVLLTLAVLVPITVSANPNERDWELFSFNYQFSSGPDYRLTLGTPTPTNVTPDNMLNNNARRNAGAAHNPPPAGWFSGAFDTERQNIFAIQSPVTQATATTNFADSGGVAVGGGSAGVGVTGPGSNVTIPPPTIPQTPPTTTTPRVTAPSFFEDGSMARLTIPAISLTNARVFSGVTYAVIDNHIGHFPNTSAWDGNIGLAAHNGGSAGFFRDIHLLAVGDEIRLTTPMGTRTYLVQSTHQIHETDFSLFGWSDDNRIVLVTCIAGGRRDMRFAVVAVEAP